MKYAALILPGYESQEKNMTCIQTHIYHYFLPIDWNRIMEDPHICLHVICMPFLATYMDLLRDG